MDLFQLNHDENYDKVCGNILFTTKGRLVYYCTFCGKYRDYKSFIAHLWDDCFKCIDDDLKECITKSNLIESKLEDNFSTLKTWLTRENTSEIVNAFTENQILIEYDSSEEDAIMEMSVNEQMQPEYYGEDFVEYISVERLDEGLIEYNNQVSYQMEQNMQIDEKKTVTNQLDADYLQEKGEDTQNNNMLTQHATTKKTAGQAEGDVNILGRKKLNIINKNEKLTKAQSKQIETASVVRSVRQRKKYLPSHISPEERKYECRVCGLAFKDSANMNYHLRRHTNKKPFSCPDCDKKFYTSAEVKSHSRVHKKLEKRFLCTDCGLTFESNFKLQSHQKRHLNQRDYVCKMCKKGFFSFKNLKRHILTHSTEKPYSCEFCSTSFKDRRGLKYHMKQHENKREYKCELCEADFNVKAALNMHIKSKHKDEYILK